MLSGPRGTVSLRSAVDAAASRAATKVGSLGLSTSPCWPKTGRRVVGPGTPRSSETSRRTTVRARDPGDKRTAIERALD